MDPGAVIIFLTFICTESVNRSDPMPSWKFLDYFPCINNYIVIVHNALSKIQFTGTDLQL